MSEPVEDVPSYDAIMGIVEEQKAVIAAMNDKIKSLEGRSAMSEEKIAALSVSAAEKTGDAVAKARSAADEAYDKVLEDLGIRKKE